MKRFIKNTNLMHDTKTTNLFGILGNVYYEAIDRQPEPNNMQYLDF